MRLIIAQGTFHDAGRQVGTAIADDLRHALVGTLLSFPDAGLHDLAALHRRAASYAREAEAWFPGGIDYLRGMADGANVNFSELCLVSFSEELLMSTAVGAEKCSTLAVPTGDGWVIGHNEDYDRFYLGRMHVVDLRVNGFPRTFMMNYPGHQGCSLNELGLAITNNSFLHPAAEGGLSKNARHFRAALADGPVAAFSALSLGDHALATHYTIGWGPDDGLLSLEVGPASGGGCVDLHDLSPRLPFCHTNHALRGSLRWDDPAPASGGTSVRRLECLEEIAASASCPSSPEAMLDLLSTPDGLLHRTDGPDELGITLATAVLRPATREMWIRDADPSAAVRDRYLSFNVSPRN